MYNHLLSNFSEWRIYTNIYQNTHTADIKWVALQWENYCQQRTSTKYDQILLNNIFVLLTTVFKLLLKCWEIKYNLFLNISLKNMYVA